MNKVQTLTDILMREVVSLDAAKMELVKLQRFDIADTIRTAQKQLRIAIRDAELLIEQQINNEHQPQLNKPDVSGRSGQLPLTDDDLDKMSETLYNRHYNDYHYYTPDEGFKAGIRCGCWAMNRKLGGNCH